MSFILSLSHDNATLEQAAGMGMSLAKRTQSIKYTVHALFSTSFAVGRPEVHFCPILDGV